MSNFDEVGKLLDQVDELRNKLETANRRIRDLEAEAEAYRARIRRIHDVVVQDTK